MGVLGTVQEVSGELREHSFLADFGIFLLEVWHLHRFEIMAVVLAVLLWRWFS